MSSGQRKWAPFQGVRLPLHARAAVVENNQARVALVALDLLGLAGEAAGGMDDFKRRVAASAGAGWKADQIVLASTHTHSAPESLALTDLYRTEAFRNWAIRLAERIGDAVRGASGGLLPCSLAAASIPAQGLSFNRRIKTARGVVSHRAVRPGDVVHGPEGPTDDEVRVLAFFGESGRPTAIFVNATAHPVYEMCIKQVSPDYPGEMARLLEERHPGAVAMFFQGAAGNINPPRVSTGAADAQQHGRQLADATDQALRQLRPVEGGELAIRWRTIRLPARSPDGNPRTEPLLAAVAALRFGESAMVFLPGEPFVEIGQAIRKASPFAFTAVVGYAEDYVGYIPTDQAFQGGGYEIGPGAWSRAAPGSEAILRREGIDLLKSLEGVRPQGPSLGGGSNR